MTKEEILAKSRDDNSRRDEMEKATMARAGQIACAVGGIVCAIIILLEGFLTDRTSFSTFAVYMSMTGTMLLMKYFRQRKPSLLISAVIQLVTAAAFLVVFVIQLTR